MNDNDGYSVEADVVAEDNVSAWIVEDDLTLNQWASPTRAVAIDSAQCLAADIAMGRGAYAALFKRGAKIPGTPPGTSVTVTIWCVARNGARSRYMDLGATRTPGKATLSTREVVRRLDAIDELLAGGWATLASDAVLRRVPADALPAWQAMLAKGTPVACFEAADALRRSPNSVMDRAMLYHHGPLSLSEMASAVGEAMGIWSAARQNVSRFANALEVTESWEVGALTPCR